jgi:hypothetical protein
MALSTKGPKLFTCPNCRKAYLGHEALPDCPACGYNYPARGGFRWDILVYLLSVLGLVSYLLVSSSYRSMITAPVQDRGAAVGTEQEKLPGGRQAPFVYPPERDANR